MIERLEVNGASIANDLADALEGRQRLQVYWADDPDAPPPGTPGLVVLTWDDVDGTPWEDMDAGGE